MYPISLLGGTLEHLRSLEKIRGKKLCCKKIYRLEVNHTEVKQVYKYIYPITCYIAEVCPYLGFLPDKKPYCASNCKTNEECLKLWKGNIPYILSVIYIERHKPKKERLTREDYRKMIRL